MSAKDRERYLAAAHAMQSGVALSIARGEARDMEPKHLRVGVNSALVDCAALAKLLIDKGILTEEEYERALADAMEAEVQRYRERLQLPDNVHLG
jgi:hypothetical protein